MKIAIFIIILIVLLFLNLSNTLHESFTDEYDNLFGGLLITKGTLPYSGFFSNHGPAAYYLSALIEFLTNHNFYKFRLTYQYLIWTGEVMLAYFIWKKFGLKDGIAAAAFFSILAISESFIWGHLLVADNLAGLFLVGSYITLFYISVKKKHLTFKSLLLISMLVFLTLLTSYTFIFAVTAIYVFGSIYYISGNRSESKKTLINILFVIFTPYLIYGLYLLITKSWQDFYFQTVIFNRDYYVYGEAAKAKNIIELAFLLFFKNITKYKELLFSFNQFTFVHPFLPTLLLANTLLWVFLLLTGKIKSFLLSFLVTIYTNIRNEPFSPGPIDFHASPYVFVSLFNGLYLIFHVHEVILKKYKLVIKILFGPALIIFLLYAAHFSRFIYDNWWNAIYDKLTSKEPYYQSHPVSPYLNRLISPEDTYFIGPYDPESNYYTNAMPASKYHYLLPAMEQSPKVHSGLLEDIIQKKPKIIIYHTEYHIFGIEPGKNFIKILRKDYATLEDLKTYENLKFTPILKFIAGFQYDLERHFFIRREARDEILRKMDSLDYIRLH